MCIVKVRGVHLTLSLMSVSENRSRSRSQWARAVVILTLFTNSQNWKHHFILITMK